MQTNLSPQAQVWTRWHQERVNNNEMDRDTSASRNSNYAAIIKEIILPQFQPKLLEWVVSTTLSDPNKKVSSH